MSEHVHSYPPGWMPWTDEEGPWVESPEMAAWRFCPPCGALLVDSGYVGDDPQCSTCQHPYTACPCACVEESENVSGRTFNDVEP